MSELIGHQSVLDLLRRLKKSGRMGSAVLLVGAAGVGKRAIVDAWLQEDGEQKQAGRNPDLLMVKRELNDKDELKKQIGIEQVRELIARLSMSAFGGGENIALIEEAELLSLDAANALLKTLEDPMGKALVILLATSTASIPATVLSRCQIVYVLLVSPAEIQTALVERGCKVEEAQMITEFATGRPGIALRLLADQELRQTYVDYKSNLDELLRATIPKRFGLLGEVAKSSKEELEELLNVWEGELHRRQAYQPLAQLVRARAAMRQNVNVTLALEHSFL